MKLKFLRHYSKRLLIALSGIFFTNVLFGQSVTGNQCVLTGTQYMYQLSPPETSPTSMNWYQTTGNIVGSGSGTALNQIYVSFPSAGSYVVKVTTSNPSGSYSLSVTAVNALSGGIISNPTQNVNYNQTPGIIYSSNPSGGSCSPNYVYQWQSSPNNVTYSNISGATASTLSFSAGLTSTTYYRRFVTETVSGNTAYSTVAQVTVYPAIVPGSVSPASQHINFNTAPSQMTLSGVSRGTNSYSYQWQSSPDGVNWTGIAGPTGTTYTPPALQATTYYNVLVVSNGANATSSSATVTVNPEVLGGTISPAYASIASGTSPGELTSMPASGGGCGGAYAYQWQTSSDGINFTNISGATAQ